MPDTDDDDMDLNAGIDQQPPVVIDADAVKNQAKLGSDADRVWMGINLDKP